MTSLIGLLLGASPYRRQLLAHHWLIDDQSGAALTSQLYRHITDEVFLGPFLDRLPPDQLLVLSHLIATSPRGVSPSLLLRALPIDESRARTAIDALVDVALLARDDKQRSLMVPDDLRPLLSHLLRDRRHPGLQGRSTPEPAKTAQQPHKLPERSCGSRRHGNVGKTDSVTRLTEAGEPEVVVEASDPLRQAIDMLLDSLAKGSLSIPSRMAERPLAISSQRWRAIASSMGDSTAEHCLSYALRCSLALGVLSSEGPRLRCTLATGEWLQLDREKQARALYELWLGDRGWCEPWARLGEKWMPRSLPRPDRIRQRMVQWLGGARPGVWYSIRSLETVSSKSLRLLATPRHAQLHSSGGMQSTVVVVLTVGLRWLGGLDVGYDAQGQPSAFRLTERGHRLLGQHTACSVRRAHATVVGE